MSYIQVRPSQARALVAISEFDVEKFRKISRELAQKSNPSIRASVLVEDVKRLSSDRKFSVALCSQLIALATFRRTRKVESSDLLSDLIEGMKKAELSEKTIKWFEDTREELNMLLDCESIRLAAKALHLSTDHENLYNSANVITDVRPVFDGDRSSVVGAIVTQLFRLHYLSDGIQRGEVELSLAMDTDDIDNLIDELQKAKQKALGAKKRFGTEFGNNIFVVGEETYGFS